MKNLKTFLIVIGITLITNNLFAQGAYVDINLGYGFQMSSQNLDYLDFSNFTVDSNFSTEEQIFVSLGKGLNFGAAFGYMFNENIGAELGLSYLLGANSEAKDIFPGGTTDYTLSSNMFRIVPSLVIASGLDGINPYAKFGLIIGIGSIIYEFEDLNAGDITILKFKFDGGVALGFNAGIGAMFSLSDNMSLFGEINVVNLSYAPTKSEITEATFNGTDFLIDLTTNDKEIEFVDSFTDDFSTSPPDSQPDKQLKQKFPFGSVGINAGLRIGF